MLTCIQANNNQKKKILWFLFSFSGIFYLKCDWLKLNPEAISNFWLRWSIVLVDTWSEGSWKLAFLQGSLHEGEELRHSGGAQSRVATLQHGNEPVQVVWASGQAIQDLLERFFLSVVLGTPPCPSRKVGGGGGWGEGDICSDCCSCDPPMDIWLKMLHEGC